MSVNYLLANAIFNLMILIMKGLYNLITNPDYLLIIRAANKLVKISQSKLEIIQEIEKETQREIQV